MRCLILLAGALALTGCATATPPAEVTRFHRLDTAAMPLAAAEFAIAPHEAGSMAAGADWRAARDAVAAALAARGLAEVSDEDASSAPYSVIVSFSRERVDQRGSGGSGVGVGVGGSTGSYGSGVGVGVGVDLTRLINGPPPDTLLRLSVRIDGEGGVSVWEGRAVTAVRSGAPAAQPGLAARRLADALFQGFPGTSGQTITVP